MADIKNFLDSDGRLKSFPAKRKMKLHALVYLAEKFDINRTYTEKEVNEFLLTWHTFSDPSTLRRELVDYGFLVRDAACTAYKLSESAPTIEELEMRCC